MASGKYYVNSTLPKAPDGSILLEGIQIAFRPTEIPDDVKTFSNPVPNGKCKVIVDDELRELLNKHYKIPTSIKNEDISVTLIGIPQIIYKYSGVYANNMNGFCLRGIPRGYFPAGNKFSVNMHTNNSFDLYCTNAVSSFD